VLAAVSSSSWLDAHGRRYEITVAWGDGSKQASSNIVSVEPASSVESAHGDSDGDLHERLDESIEAASRQSETERLEQLDAMAQRIESVSSEKSLDKLSGRLGDWLELDERASQPQAEASTRANDAEGEFDVETAQLHDVIRESAADGWQYSCVLLDAAGRTRQIPLSEAEGRPMYEVMQRIKASPLLERVYRQLAMPLLDQLLDTQQRGPATAPDARGEPAETSEISETSATPRVPDDGASPPPAVESSESPTDATAAPP